MKPRDFHKMMNVAEVTAEMTKAIVRVHSWRPRNPVVPCSVTCEPKGTRFDGTLIPMHHGGHTALPMLIPIAVSASVTIGNVRVKE